MQKTSYKQLTIKNIGKGYEQGIHRKKIHKYLKRLASHSHLTKCKLRGVIFTKRMPVNILEILSDRTTAKYGFDNSVCSVFLQGCFTYLHQKFKSQFFWILEFYLEDLFYGYVYSNT